MSKAILQCIQLVFGAVFFMATGGDRGQGGVLNYFGPKTAPLPPWGCNLDGLAVLADQSEVPALGLLVSGSR